MSQANDRKDRIVGYDRDGNEIHEVTATRPHVFAYTYLVFKSDLKIKSREVSKKEINNDSGGENIDWHGGSIKNRSM